MRPDFVETARWYDNNVAMYGHDVRAMGYGNPISQKLKFGALASVLPLDRAKILDVGCGFADFLDFLGQRGISVDYTGYDISPAMIAKARELHPDIRLEVRDILENPPEEKFDVVVSTGIFYFVRHEPEETMRQLVAAMFACAKKALAFTTISAWGDHHEEGEFYADPLKTIQFCRDITPWLVFRHDYHGRDFAIYMYKERP